MCLVCVMASVACRLRIYTRPPLEAAASGAQSCYSRGSLGLWPQRSAMHRCASPLEVFDKFSYLSLQDDIIGVAWFMDACLERVYTSAGPPMGDQASDQPSWFLLVLVLLLVCSMWAHHTRRNISRHLSCWLALRGSTGSRNSAACWAPKKSC